MQLVLIPGFWLDASSWNEVSPLLRDAGHTVTALTLPGMTHGADRSAVTLRDHVDAVIATVDSLSVDSLAGASGGGPIVLVGHSGGGAIAHAVVDARPESIARVVYVDSGPLGDGDCINDGLPVVNGEIPLPEWEVLGDYSLVDLDDELRAAFVARAIPQPARVAADLQQLSDPRRYDVPVTVITCELPKDRLLALMAEGHPYVAELTRVTTTEIIDLPTGHWPQFTKPRELATAILAALG